MSNERRSLPPRRLSDRELLESIASRVAELARQQGISARNSDEALRTTIAVRREVAALRREVRERAWQREPEALVAASG